ncbi:MAG TPA: hypothetical protein DEQ61_08330 [Streptomyces sp.]|nr:hypothetical protein [Streptomyces sp.]
MLNNQVIITDDTLRAYGRRSEQGIADAAVLTDGEWEELRARNANSTKAQLVKCAKCWELYREEQWLKTYNRGATRVISHQAGEARPDHEYESVETPEHRAYNNRAFMIGETEGYNPRKEAWAPNRKTRADVLLTGTLAVAYEHQHSPFSATGRYSAPERTRLAASVERTAMWHSTSDKVRGQVPILRTDGGLPPKVIENPNHRHEFRGGIYRIEIYTCTVRDGHECPDRKFSGCGKPHARGQVTAGQLDDVLRGAPIGAYMPVVDARAIRAPRFFWTDRKSYDHYAAYMADSESLSLRDGGPLDRAKTRRGVCRGHSRAKEAELEAMRAQTVDLCGGPRCATCGKPAPLRDERERCRCWSSRPADPGQPTIAAPAVRPPTPHRCSSGVTPCGAPARFYACGWRCDGHSPAAMRAKGGGRP